MLSAARLTEGLCAEQYVFAENQAGIDTFLCGNPSVTASPCHLPLHCIAVGGFAALRIWRAPCGYRGGFGRIPRR